ncbi:MAG TPA: plastocyanin/azurin family copper-binding protein [Steroidobacteraceae bacterium]|nr:plastocyanin/azurin family copper-binding protein [Steroidobacteraceae bacterium]
MRRGRSDAQTLGQAARARWSRLGAGEGLGHVGDRHRRARRRSRARLLPEHDARIIAATPIVGGGESATVKFATSLLQAGARYAFFCTSPGHSTVMRGTFKFGGNSRLVRASEKTG